MTENPIGINFNTVFIGDSIPHDPKIRQVMLWGRKFSLMGLTPSYDFGAAGNLSFRTEKGFIITGTGKDLGKLQEGDFVEVRNCNFMRREITAIGKYTPSMESMLHCSIYGAREDVAVIFHVHDEEVMKNCETLGLKCTRDTYTPGSVELMEEVLKVLGDSNYIILKNHGIISLGGSVDEAGERIIDISGKIQELS